MPDWPIIDTHVHLWDTANLRYPWLASLPTLNRPFLPADFREHTAEVEVEQFVFVQADVAVEEATREAPWVTQLAVDEPRLGGIVAWAPLERGLAVRDLLSALVADHPLVRGVRRLLQFDPDPALCLREDFIAGVRLLESFDLHFELCIKGDEQLRNATELARRCPGVRFMLDHIAKPFIREGVLEPWASLLAEFAALPNTWCKLSGVVTEASHDTWTPADLQPYLDHVLSVFPGDRVMYGSDWPVVLLAAPYRRWVEVLDAATRDQPEVDRRRLWRDNARAFYRLAARHDAG